jgi:phage terminase small subunit
MPSDRPLKKFLQLQNKNGKKMARPRTPTNILDLKGAFKTHPERKRKSEPKGNGDFNTAPPKHLNLKQKKTWKEVIALVPAGVLTGSDLIHVEIVACLLAEFRELKGMLETSRITRLTSEMGKIGLNPSARASLSVDTPKTNKYADE